MGKFRVKARSRITIFGLKDSSVSQEFSIWRKYLTPNSNWIREEEHAKPLTGYSWPASEFDMDYLIIGYNGPDRVQSRQRMTDNGEEIYFYHEDGGDEDFNDLVVRCSRHPPHEPG